MISIALSFLFVLLAAWAILVPFFSESGEESSKAVDTYAEKKERILSNLEDLEFDYLAKKISEEEYNQSKSEILKEASRELS